jgi:hypothetical protein
MRTARSPRRVTDVPDLPTLELDAAGAAATNRFD